MSERCDNETNTARDDSIRTQPTISLFAGNPTTLFHPSSAMSMEEPQTPQFKLQEPQPSPPQTQRQSEIPDVVIDFRLRNGLCYGCGTRIYDICSHDEGEGTLSKEASNSGQGGVKPVTIPGVVTEGRCLHCYPDRKTSNDYNQKKSSPTTTTDIPPRTSTKRRKRPRSYRDENDLDEDGDQCSKRTSVISGRNPIILDSADEHDSTATPNKYDAAGQRNDNSLAMSASLPSTTTATTTTTPIDRECSRRALFCKRGANGGKLSSHASNDESNSSKAAAISSSSILSQSSSVGTARKQHQQQNQEEVRRSSIESKSSSNNNDAATTKNDDYPDIGKEITIHDGEGHKFVGKIRKGTTKKGYGRFVHVHKKGPLTKLESTYEGEYEHGLFCGQGKFDDIAKGVVYEGQFQQGVAHGYGECQWGQGWNYQGSWINDRREGHGILKQEGVEAGDCGEIYDGQWKNDQWHGRGELKFNGGGCYTGEFKNHKIEGRGRYVFADGSVYEGTFKNDHREGNGTMIYEDGTKYVGQWRNNWRDGKSKRIKIHTVVGMLVDFSFPIYGWSEQKRKS